MTAAIVNKIADRVDECNDAIKTTMGAAQMGRAFANNMATLCDAFTAHVSGDEEALIASSIAIADKGYGRSIQAHGQLICIRAGLSEVSLVSIISADSITDGLLGRWPAKSLPRSPR